MRKPYQLPAWTKNSSYYNYIVPRSGIELTTSHLHSFIMAKVSHALNHSAMETDKQSWWKYNIYQYVVKVQVTLKKITQVEVKLPEKIALQVQVLVLELH